MVEQDMAAHVVLYVEDDDASFVLLTIVLKEQAPAIRVFRARDGEEALAFLRESGPNGASPSPDLILMDLNLPKRSGLEVLSDIKASESFRAIPVVMFTTSSAEIDRNKALQGGARDYVIKPATFDLFVEAVRTAFSLRKSAARGL